MENRQRETDTICQDIETLGGLFLLKYSFVRVTDTHDENGHGKHSISDVSIEEVEIESIEVELLGEGFEIPVSTVRRKLGVKKFRKLLFQIENQIK